MVGGVGFLLEGQRHSLHARTDHRITKIRAEMDSQRERGNWFCSSVLSPAFFLEFSHLDSCRHDPFQPSGRSCSAGTLPTA